MREDSKRNRNNQWQEKKESTIVNIKVFVLCSKDALNLARNMMKVTYKSLVKYIEFNPKIMSSQKDIFSGLNHTLSNNMDSSKEFSKKELQNKYFPRGNYDKIEYQIAKELHKNFWEMVISCMEIRLIIQIVNKEMAVAQAKEDFSKKIELSKFDFSEGI